MSNHPTPRHGGWVGPPDMLSYIFVLDTEPVTEPPPPLAPWDLAPAADILPENGVSVEGTKTKGELDHE